MLDKYRGSEEENMALMTKALRFAKENSYAERGKIGIVAIVPVKSGMKTVAWKEYSACNNLPEKFTTRIINRRRKCETNAPTVEESHTLPEVLHAEEMLACSCARKGLSLENAIVFITRTPCKKCAAHLIQAGIKKLYYFSVHPHGDGLPLLNEANIPSSLLTFKQDILEEKYL